MLARAIRPGTNPPFESNSIGSASAARTGSRSAAFPALAVFSLESPPRYRIQRPRTRLSPWRHPLALAAPARQT